MYFLYFQQRINKHLMFKWVHYVKQQHVQCQIDLKWLTVCFNVFLIMCGQQWSSVAQRNKIISRNGYTGNIYVASIHCWFWSFCGIYWKYKKYHQIYPLKQASESGENISDFLQSKSAFFYFKNKTIMNEMTWNEMLKYWFIILLFKLPRTITWRHK